MPRELHVERGDQGSVACRSPLMYGPNRNGDYFAALLAVTHGDGGQAAAKLLTPDECDELATKLAQLAAECRRRHGLTK